MVRHVVVRWVFLALAVAYLGLLAACGGSSSSAPAPVSVSISPAAESVVTGGQQQFLASVAGGNGNTAVTWAVDGTTGGSAAVGVISSSGLYAAPAAAGTHSVTVTSVQDPSKSASSTLAVTDLAGVTTYHYDAARDGVNAHEYLLNPANVRTSLFGKVFACPVDGAIYTEPLWMPALTVNGSVHNVVFVATQHNSLYAFDADASPCLTLWHVTLIDGAHGGTSGETPVCWDDVGYGYGNIQPEIGVTGTPVIDPATNTLYVVSKSETGGCGGATGPAFFQRLHAIDIGTGNEVTNSPVTIVASVPGTGDGSSGGMLSFNPQMHGQRPGLALLTNVPIGGSVYTMVVISWASHEDASPYHGWMIGYNGVNVHQQLEVFNATPNGGLGGIWMSGGAPAIDASNNLFLATGNGTFDANMGGNDYGDSVLKIGSNGAFTISDFFTPTDQAALALNDTDQGSGGLVLLPDQTSGPRHLLVQGGKDGLIYLIDRDNMGSFLPATNNVVQEFQADNGSWTTPAFWQNTLYIAGSGDQPSCDALKAYSFTAGSGFNPTPTSNSTHCFPFPGATPVVSSAGTSNGLVWVADVSCYVTRNSTCASPALLYAFDATNLNSMLWNSSQAANMRDQAGLAVKFTTPTVANGKVYIGTRTELDVYGMLP